MRKKWEPVSAELW